MRLILILLACLVQLSCFAWSGPGHMIIAAEAYRSLSPDLQKKVSEILQHHPDYAKWSASFQGGGMDLDTFVFMRSSTWPDEIRRSGGDSAKYDHPHWHYVDWPVRPPTFAQEPEPSPQDDVLFGISECEKALSSSNTSPELKAVYLSWLIHLVGDIHQPLHCCSLFSDQYPQGDKGGNDFYVMPGQKGIKLHSFWDGLLGTRIHAQTQLNEAIEYGQQFPRSSLPGLMKDKTARDWSLEGWKLAIDKVYLRGELKGGTSFQTAVPLPAGYTKTAKEVGERQAALAGYRLADEIMEWLK